jgi:hypothetical protein
MSSAPTSSGASEPDSNHRSRREREGRGLDTLSFRTRWARQLFPQEFIKAKIGKRVLDVAGGSHRALAWIIAFAS